MCHRIVQRPMSYAIKSISHHVRTTPQTYKRVCHPTLHALQREMFVITVINYIHIIFIIVYHYHKQSETTHAGHLLCRPIAGHWVQIQSNLWVVFDVSLTLSVSHVINGTIQAERSINNIANDNMRLSLSVCLKVYRQDN